MSDNKLGNILVELRKEKGLTQRQLADELCISDKAISRWERGDTFPNLEMLYHISKFYNISFHELLAARVDEATEDDIIKNIMEDVHENKKETRKRKRLIILTVILVIVLVVVAIIFTKSYNRFRFYKIGFESDEFYPTKSVYVETNVRDVIYFGDIKLRNYTPKLSDTISVDIFFMKNEEEVIIQNYSTLDDVYLVGSQSYVEIDDFSDYFDNLYVKVTITDEKNKVIEHTTKLTFVLDFSNNKIFYNEEFKTEKLNYETTSFNDDEIKAVLLKNGFEESYDDKLFKETKNYKIRYSVDSKIVNYLCEDNGLSYRYTYKLNNNILEVLVKDDNLTIVENYQYDVKSNKMECIVGTCNNYKNVMDLLDEKILYLFN